MSKSVLRVKCGGQRTAILVYRYPVLTQLLKNNPILSPPHLYSTKGFYLASLTRQADESQHNGSNHPAWELKVGVPLIYPGLEPRLISFLCE